MLAVRLPAKFLVLVLGILVVFFGILSAVIIDREARLLTEKSAEQEDLLASMIAADLKDNMLAGRPRSTLNMIENLRDAHGVARLEVLRRDGKPAFGIKNKQFFMPQIEQAFVSGKTVDFNEEGEALLHTNIFPLMNEGACRRCHRSAGDTLGVILISHSLQETMDEISASKRQLVLLLLGLIVVMGGGLYMAVRKVVLTPLRSLHDGARIIGTGDLAHRIEIRSGDEFSELASSFNDMAARLKETYGSLESMVKVRTAELNESVRLMRGILSSMSTGVVLLAGDGRVKLINPPGAWILGRGNEDLAGKKLAEIVPETSAFMSARVSSYEEISVRTPDELTTPVGFTCSPFGGEQEQGDRIVVFQDLTELRSLQEELLNKERFASIGRVVAGVAHEIRNPLFGISAIGQIFERDLKDPAHLELVRALLGETKRLNQLVEELLIYGRPMKLKREDTDLRVLWEEVLDLHREELKRRDIKVTGDYAVRHPVAYFDPYQIRQVFLNVLRNAIEALPKGGAIDISMLLADSYLLFRIADTGTGIPQKSLAHIFDLFFTTKPKGTGLGLAICRKIMRDHGGDITIESTEGHGTMVTVTLPYRGAVEARPARTG